MTTMIGKNSVKTSFRATASVIALAIASLTVPTLAQAKRMGSGGKSVRPASIGKAPAQPAAPAAPTASKAATPSTPPHRPRLQPRPLGQPPLRHLRLGPPPLLLHLARLPLPQHAAPA